MNVKKLLPYTKAIVAGLTGLLTVMAVVVSVASDGLISGNDWAAIITSVVGAITATGAVFQFPNVEVK